MTKWLFMASDNEGAEDIWDLHIIECDFSKALKYCLAKAKKYIASEEGGETPDEDIYPLDRGGYYVQYPDHHVAFIVVQLDEITAIPVLSEYSVQDTIDEAESEYASWQSRCEDKSA